MKSLILLSGGLDSAVLLYHQLALGRECSPVFFAYGQKQLEMEREANTDLCIQAGVEGRCVAVYHLYHDGDLVPARNLIFLTVAANVAIELKCKEICIGVTGGDSDAFPDCSEATLACFALAFWNAKLDVTITTPFLSWSKAAVIRRGIELKVPFELTWSCYEGGSQPCGVCQACIKRLEALAEVNATTL